MQTKKSYTLPKLSVYGNVEELTLGSGQLSKDAWNGANTAGPSANDGNNGNTTGNRYS